MTQSPCYQAFAFRNFSSGYRCTTSKYKAPLITIDTWMMITKKNDEVKPKKKRIKDNEATEVLHHISGNT